LIDIARNRSRCSGSNNLIRHGRFVLHGHEIAAVVLTIANAVRGRWWDQELYGGFAEDQDERRRRDRREQRDARWTCTSEN
jgi:hypothetical protein